MSTCEWCHGTADLPRMFIPESPVLEWMEKKLIYIEKHFDGILSSDEEWEILVYIIKMKMKLYKVEITPITEQKFCAQKPYVIEITTDNIEWSMEQYQRNRQPLNWKLL